MHCGWYHWFNAPELGQTLGDGEGQGSLACCSPWGQEESDMTWQLNNNNIVYNHHNYPSPHIVTIFFFFLMARTLKVGNSLAIHWSGLSLQGAWVRSLVSMPFSPQKTKTNKQKHLGSTPLANFKYLSTLKVCFNLKYGWFTVLS